MVLMLFSPECLGVVCGLAGAGSGLVRRAAEQPDDE